MKLWTREDRKCKRAVQVGGHTGGLGTSIFSIAHEQAVTKVTSEEIDKDGQQDIKSKVSRTKMVLTIPYCREVK